MDLLLIRHAIAAPGENDAARPLTAKGKARFQPVTLALADAGVRFDLLLHSPKVRAVQTAKMLTRCLEGESVKTPLLAKPPSEELLALLRGDVVGLVGHEPYLSRLLGWLVLGDAKHGRAFDLRKGSVAWLVGAPRPGGCQLKALLTPRLARGAAR